MSVHGYPADKSIFLLQLETRLTEVCMYVYLFIRHGYIHKLYNENDYIIRLKYPVQ